MDFDLDPDAFECQYHRGTDVLGVVVGRDREIALLVARAVAQVRAIRRPLAARIPEGRFRVKVVETEVVALIEADVVEDEEFQLRADVDGVGQAELLDVLFGLLGHEARVAGVIATGHRVFHVADQDQRLMLGKRVQLRRRRIREEQHVRLVDRLEPANRGPVEANAFGEKVFSQLVSRDREMLPGPRQVREPQVYDLNALLFGELNYVFWGHSLPPYQATGARPGPEMKIVELR